jgi:hypothetical protein
MKAGESKGNRKERDGDRGWEGRERERERKRITYDGVAATSIFASPPTSLGELARRPPARHPIGHGTYLRNSRTSTDASVCERNGT